MSAARFRGRPRATKRVACARNRNRSFAHVLDRPAPRRTRRHPARRAGPGGELRARSSSRAASIYVSGQISQDANGLILGKLGRELDVEAGAAAAKACALALIAQAKKAAGGDLDRVRVVKLTGFVNSTPDFTDQPKVINGASDFFVEVFGEQGPARALGGQRRRRCRSASRSRSRGSSRLSELPAGFLRLPHRASRAARARRAAWSRTAAPRWRRRSRRATASRSTCSARPTARRWCSTTRPCRG